MELGDEPELVKVFRQNLAEQVDVVILGCAAEQSKPMPCFPTRAEMMSSEPCECARDDEQDVGRIDLDELLVRMLAPALRRNRGNRSLEDLEQRLLHTLAGDIARVIDGFSALRAILSTSSMQMISRSRRASCRSRRPAVASGGCSRHPHPKLHPPSVSAVASATAVNGTFSRFASVCAR